MVASSSQFVMSLFFSISSFFFLVIVSLATNGHALHGVDDSHFHVGSVSSLLPAPTCSSSREGSKQRGKLEVVHKHGACSKLIQGKAKHPSHEELLTRDERRAKSIKNRHAFNSGKQSLQDKKATIPARSGSTIGSGNYIVTVGLGTPKKDLSLIFDTGSDLSWTQCQPCTRSCYSQQEPIFSPSLSSSYSNVTCNSPSCKDLVPATGVQPGCSSSTCVYGIQYGDSSFSVGFFATEKLTLTSTDTIDNFLFGCGENNQGLFGGAAGLLGLGRGKLSILSQATKVYEQVFSYCLPSSSSSTGYLTFGNAGIPHGVQFTTLSTSGNSFYGVDITAIYVGGIKLPISQSVFTTAGTIIDSGTVISRLPPAVYTALRTAFRAQMTKYPLTKALSILDTCYDLSSYTSVTVPKISFMFSGNVKVDIGFVGTLYASSVSQICLAFAGNGDATDTAIFGNTQQKTLQVVYNVAGGKLGFAPGGCS